MSDLLPPPAPTPEQPAPQAPPHIPDAHVKRRFFSAIWLIPIIAALVAGYLGVRSYSERGSVVTIAFHTADGLSIGQTPVKYKSVMLGTVDKITLNDDMNGVVVRVRMISHTDALLTNHTRFWIEKPRLTSTNLSDIVAGTYIELDPGAPGGDYQDEFTGLENQPALPADDQGTTYVLHADRLGSVTEGSAIYYRGVNVGKVLGTDIGDGFGPIAINAFITAPYDQFVKPTTRFWDDSGFTVKVGNGGVHVEVQSVQTVLAGGIAFYTPQDSVKVPQADAKTIFTLYDDKKTADAAAFSRQVPYVTYLQSSIKDLAPGSPVQIFGVPVGQVTDVKLALNPQTGDAKVRVAFEIEPERAFGPNADPALDPAQIMRQLVQKGMRVKMEASDLIAGQEVLSLEFVPKTAPVDVASEGDVLVLPGEAAGLDSLTDMVADVASKLDQIPFEDIGKNLDHLIASADKSFGGPEMQQAVHALAQTMANAEDVSRSAKENLTPALQRLPQISAQLQEAVTQANAFMSSVNSGYGQDSDFQRSAKRVLDQVNDAARSIRLLADYLERHPEALVQGKADTKPQEKKP